MGTKLGKIGSDREGSKMFQTIFYTSLDQMRVLKGKSPLAKKMEEKFQKINEMGRASLTHVNTSWTKMNIYDCFKQLLYQVSPDKFEGSLFLVFIVYELPAG